MDHAAERNALIGAARRMNALGINQGTSGNLGLRVDDGVLLTPSGASYETLEPPDIVFMDWQGDWRAAPGRRPTSEWRFHRDILEARAEFAAVVHSHAPYATSLACLGLDIPAFHYMIAVAGGPTIRCAPYATFGTQALSAHALAALEDRKACLLANHGMIACGADLDGALALAVEVETLARQYWQALQIGTPQILEDEEIERVRRKMEELGYGAGSDDGAQSS